MEACQTYVQEEFLVRCLYVITQNEYFLVSKQIGILVGDKTVYCALLCHVFNTQLNPNYRYHHFSPN